MTDTEAWRRINIGRLLNNAVERFEGRVLSLLAERGQDWVRPSHISLTRNLDVAGTTATELARRAGMTKQAMAEIIGQCEALGVVERDPDPTDGRAKIVRFTERGLAWLEAFRGATSQAEAEMRRELGAEATVALHKALALYAGQRSSLKV